MQAVPALNVCAIGAEISREQPGCGQFVFVQTKLRQSSTASNTEKCRQLPIEPIFVQPLVTNRDSAINADNRIGIFEEYLAMARIAHEQADFSAMKSWPLHHPSHQCLENVSEIRQ